MRFTSLTFMSALRTSAQTRINTQKQNFVDFHRQYGSNAEQQKKEGSSISKVLLTSLLGGSVAGGALYNNSSNVEAKEKKPVVFNSEHFIQLKLAEIKPVSHNTSIFRFELPKDHVAGLPIASCIMVKQPGNDGVTRPYTPISESDAEGHVDFMIKKYKTGTLTPIIHDLKVGDTMEMKGPISKYNWEKDQNRNVGMIAGGTGITPMLQIIRRVFDGKKSTDKKTKVTLLFGNVTEEDILLKDELDQIAKKYPDRFKVVYALSKAPENWHGVKGYIDKEVAKEHLPAADQQDMMIFVCGPPPMVESISGPKASIKEQGELKGILKELGYTEKNVFKF